MTKTGGCQCNAVRFEVRGPLRDVVLCHCGMCRRTHGHIGAYTNARRGDVTLVELRGLKWYQSSDFARRGFCTECGGSVFWERNGSDVISISAGMLDAPTGLKTVLQIFVDSAGDYYRADPDVPQRRD